ncbi:uncharacterized protein YALI1_E17849g [Yarrowia lipolytica]|uniref:Uncharacterized protein n=1 Tax=Yarrowia lipolytica TaxID=4952 RepID=A0A1D8NIG7_YARLL|nr:hypothetical protein YALI1_E17849g [Yarrowia lipolytica]
MIAVKLKPQNISHKLPFGFVQSDLLDCSRKGTACRLPALLGVCGHLHSHEVDCSCVDGETIPRNEWLQHGHNVRNICREAVLFNVLVDQVVIGRLIVHGRVRDRHMVSECGFLRV